VKPFLVPVRVSVPWCTLQTLDPALSCCTIGILHPFPSARTVDREKDANYEQNNQTQTQTPRHRLLLPGARKLVRPARPDKRSAVRAPAHHHRRARIRERRAEAHIRLVPDDLPRASASAHARTAERARTEPMERKKPNVAAELSMYCESVCSAPRGPGPALRARVSMVPHPNRSKARTGGWSRRQR
jgi:hypothetical protein